MRTTRPPLPLLATVVGAALALCAVAADPAGAQPSLDESAREPVRYVGEEQPDKRLHDGGLRHAVGVHSYQVYRANRAHPVEGDVVGFTYSHQPYLAYWKDRFYLEYVSNLVEEHAPPTRTMLTTSADGLHWSDPIVAFPIYVLPEVRRGDTVIPAGRASVMHQRMGWYVAPSGRLLMLAFYGLTATKRHSPNVGNGLGRVVREVYEDGSLGPIHFIRYNRHAGWDESNTRYPFYKTSDDAGFVEACEALLADKLRTLQWWEEDRGKDGFYVIDPSDVEGAFEFTENVTTSLGAGKAFAFFHRPDGVVVGLWKNQWSALSPDEGKTWTPLTRSTTLRTTGAKVWGQRTEDGRYALVHDHSATRNRFPLVVMTGDDGHTFGDIFVVQGEIPPLRYQGSHKNHGPQYVRGIVEGNGDPPGAHLWNVYSMSKEDIWISRTRVPVSGTVEADVEQDFENLASVSDLELWNLYVPQWAPVTLRADPEDEGNTCLELRDEEPYDHARVERIFPESRGKVTVTFRVRVERVSVGRALEIEVQDRHGTRPMRLRLDRESLGLDRKALPGLGLIPIERRKWYEVSLRFDVGSQTYDVLLDGETHREDLPFADEVDSLERLVFRTGPYRADVRGLVVEPGAPRPGLYTEDLPGGELRLPANVFLVDDVRTSRQQ